MKLNEFWKVYDPYCDGYYVNVDLASRLSHYLGVQKPHMPFERPSREWKYPIAFIALKVAHYSIFGNIQAGDVALYDDELKQCMVVAQAADKVCVIPFEKLREEDDQHYSVWLPLFCKSHLISAMRDLSGWQKRVIADWAEEVPV